MKHTRFILLILALLVLTPFAQAFDRIEITEHLGVSREATVYGLVRDAYLGTPIAVSSTSVLTSSTLANAIFVPTHTALDVPRTLQAVVTVSSTNAVFSGTLTFVGVDIRGNQIVDSLPLSITGTVATTGTVYTPEAYAGVAQIRSAITVSSTYSATLTVGGGAGLGTPFVLTSTNNSSALILAGTNLTTAPVVGGTVALSGSDPVALSTVDAHALYTGTTPITILSLQ